MRESGPENRKRKREGAVNGNASQQGEVALSELSSLEMVRCYCAEGEEQQLSPLYLACKAGDVQGVQALLECTRDMVENETEAVKKFVFEGIEAWISKAETKDGERDSAPLHVAAHHGHTSIASLLVVHKADLETRNFVIAPQMTRTPLLIAAENGHAEMVALLIAHKANVEATGDWGRENALRLAAGQGHSRVVALLVEHGADFESMVKIAAERRRPETVALLISLKANINAARKSAPLYYAAQNGDTETTTLLLSHNANLEAKGNFGSTPLHNAAGRGHTSIVSLLLTHKANIEAKSNYQCTPLHHAAINGHNKMAEFLLQNKANIEATNEDNYTPLHNAAKKGYIKALSVLVKHKANIEAKDKDGKTPLDLAKKDRIKTILSDAKKLL